MDTKLKSIKYSIFTKFLCWLLSVVLFAFSFSVVSKIVLGSFVFGFEAFIDKKQVDFYDTNEFKIHFQSDFSRAVSIASEEKDVFFDEVNKYKEDIVDEVYNEFLEAKAEIIGEELYYAVNNWDSEYYQYEDSVDEIVNNEDTTSLNVTISDDKADSFKLPDDAGRYITVPHYAPENVKVASYALNTANGKEFLKYEPLVRDSAFEGEFLTFKNVGYYRYSFGVYYSLSDEQVKKEIARIYDDNSKDFYDSYHGTEHLKSYLKEYENLKYYLVNHDGEVTSNVEEIPSNLSNKTHYVLVNGANVKIVGFDDDYYNVLLDKKQIKTLCLYFDEDFNSDDTYALLYEMYGIAKQLNAKMLIIEFMVMLLLSVLFLIIWLRLVGKHSGEDKARICFVDKIPNDIHFLLSFGVIATVITVFCMLVTYDLSIEFWYCALLSRLEALLPLVALLLIFAFFTEWLASVVRIKRAGMKYFKNTVICKVFELIKKIILKLVKFLGYKPKAVKIRFVFIFALYLLINLALLILGGLFIWDFPPVTIFVVFGILAFNIVVGYFVGEYINTLDKIIVASSENKDINLNEYTLPRSLKILSDNLSVKNKSIDKAVAEAIKNEQMKTQLITNVSHDLKTPLTSLINYSDLLSKCELDNEDAVKYVEVINQKSDKLKHLIEDLIEASKASTGNVVLNKTKLNLCELAVQAIVEYTPDLEKNFNTIRFNEPAEAPVVYADGTKTYRIISNLLSNVKKYSAPDTRVYVGVYKENSYGCFEIKNISKEPLDINPEQLTERFVRGDESRTNEGNGLGLAIAKDLCALQGGILELKIDGDLFKATVKLPLSE